MESNLGSADLKTLEQWLEDVQFINWAKQSNTDDVKQWESYFNLHPHQWELGKIGRSMVLGIEFQSIPKKVDKTDAALGTLLNQLDQQKGLNIKKNSKRERISWNYMGVAATIAAFVLASAAIYWQYVYNPRIVLTTEFGQQQETTLPDGSSVTLNANSKLRYSKQDPRTVWLDGEAYFTVARKIDTDADFTVITDDLSVTVLGTSFNVNTRNDQTEVFLEEGKVSLDIVDSLKGRIEMDPGDLIVYSHEDNNLQERRKDASALQTSSWKEGALIFKEKPLIEALFEIEDIYGIQFIIQTDDLLAETITGGVPIRNLEVSISTLTEVYGLQMKITGNRYFITDRR